MTLSDITWQYARGGFAELYKLPTRREPLTNDWAEHDGLEVDLSEPVWEPHTLSVEIHVPSYELANLKQALKAGIVNLPIPGYYRRYLKLRYVSSSEMAYRLGWHTMTLTFSNDDP